MSFEIEKNTEREYNNRESNEYKNNIGKFMPKTLGEENVILV